MGKVVIVAVLACASTACLGSDARSERLRAALTEETDETRVDARFDPVEDADERTLSEVNEARRQARAEAEARILAERGAAQVTAR